MKESKKLRVIHISRGFCDYLIELVNALSHFAEVHLILSLSDEWVENFLKPEVIVYKSKSPRVNNFYNINTLFKTYKYIKCINPDIIHIQNGVVWELLLIRLLKNIPFVITVHDVTMHPLRKRNLLERYQQHFLDYGIRKAKCIILHGSKMIELAKKRYSNLTSIMLYENIDHGIISRYGSSVGSEIPRNNVVLLFGNIDANKGIEYFIKAERYVRQVLSEVTFIIAGNARDPFYYKRIVDEDQRIVMRLRRQSDAEVNELFCLADVLVLPYIEASQSGVLQLGFSYGIPSIVTRVGGLPDIIEHRANGLIVEKKNALKLAEAIVELLTNVGLRKKIISNIIAQRADRFDWRNIAKKTLSAYINVLRIGKK